MEIKSKTSKSDIEKSPVKRVALKLAGHFFVGMGILGAILPLVPTTIFLILAAGCYAKSSPRFHAALMNNKLVGKHLSNYLEKKGTPVNVKVSTIAFLWLGIGASIYFAELQTWVVIILLLIAIAVTWHILALKTYKPDEK